MSASVLFDAPGPKARARHRIIAIVGAVLFALMMWWVIKTLADKGNFEASKWTPFLELDTWTQYLIPGLLGTLKAAAISMVLAGILGVVLGMGRLSTNKAIRWISTVFVEFFRAVPVLVMMIFAFSVVLTMNSIPPNQKSLIAVVFGLTLYNAAVVAELIRSGVFGLPKGQREAGLSIGLNESRTLRLILLPQAITAMLPALIGQMIVILKDSALGSIITYEELLRVYQNLPVVHDNVIPTMLVVAAIFILINYTLSVLVNSLERRLRSRGATTLKPGTMVGGPGAEPTVVPGAAS